MGKSTINGHFQYDCLPEGTLVILILTHTCYESLRENVSTICGGGGKKIDRSMEWLPRLHVSVPFSKHTKRYGNPPEISSISGKTHGSPSLFLWQDLICWQISNMSSATETHHHCKREKQQKLQDANEKQRLFQHSTRSKMGASENDAFTWIYYVLLPIYGHVNIKWWVSSGLRGTLFSDKPNCWEKKTAARSQVFIKGLMMQKQKQFSSSILHASRLTISRVDGCLRWWDIGIEYDIDMI